MNEIMEIIHHLAGWNDAYDTLEWYVNTLQKDSPEEYRKLKLDWEKKSFKDEVEFMNFIEYVFWG